MRVDLTAFADPAFGFLLSAVMAASVFVVMKWTGPIEVTGVDRGSLATGGSVASSASHVAVFGFGSLAMLLLTDVIVGRWEELVFRGLLATGLLWLSMGMHIGRNFFQGPVFGFAAGGHETASLISQKPVGPSWLTGDAFGPEGGIITIPVFVLAVMAMRWWTNRTRSQRVAGYTDPVA